MEKKTIRSGAPFVFAGVGVLAVALTAGIGTISSYLIAAGVGCAAFALGKKKYPDRVVEVETAPKSGNAEVDALIREARGQLDQIAAANDAIADPALSRQIEDIEATCRQILQRLEEQPNMLSQLRTFLRYYLPATLKLLNARAALEAEVNAGGSPQIAARIAKAVGEVQSAFHKQLDALNEFRFINLESEMDVLADMLKSDGLTAEPDAPAVAKEEPQEDDPFASLFAKGEKKYMGEFSGFALVPEQGAIPQKHQLDPDMQRRIEAIAARVDIRDNAAVMGFGARAQKEMGTFSDIALEQMLRQDIKPLESVMQTLAEQIKSCSFTAQAKGLFRRVFGGAAPLAEVQAAYEKAIPRINACADEMTDRRVALMRDSALLDRLYERNEGLYRELCSLIVVGDEVIAQARARGDKEQDIARMERRVQDLRITQVASTQLAAQIRAVQASDELTYSRLQAALEVTIPLWKSQMAAALGLARATDSLTMQKRAGEEAARGIKSGARELSAQTRAYAEAADGSDQTRAQQTADALLAELSEIEASLAEQQKIRRADPSAERGV